MAAAPQSAFDQLVDRYYRDWWRLSPAAGSRAGLYEFDAALELPGVEWIEQRKRHLAQASAALRSIKVPPSGTLAALDRRTFESHLSVGELRIDQLQHWRQDPSGPLTDAVDAVFELVMRRDLAKDETAYAIVSRLEKLPANLRAARDRIDDPVALWNAVADQTVPGGIEFVRDAARELSARHPRLSGQVESAAALACIALEEYGQWVHSLQERKLKEEVAAGPAALARLVRGWHGIDRSLDEIETLGWTLVQFFRDELEQHARRIDPGATWQQIMDRARDTFAATDRDMLAEYRRVTEDLRSRMIHEGVLGLPPGETCKVISAPAFLRALLPTAAYTSPGPLDPRQIGVFFVSDPGPGLAPTAYRANVAQHYGIEETCVHEAYPGHHVQLCWANRAGSLTRQMADHIIFMEGWTLYCEQWMIDADWFPDPALKINYLVGQLWRAYRMIIDVGVHTRRMTVPQAVTMLMEGVGFTRERAVAELNWYSQSPGVPLSYMMGKRDTLDLRDAFLKGNLVESAGRSPSPSQGEGRGEGKDLRSLDGPADRKTSTLRDFHSWLLQFGSIPQRWLWEHMPK
jgi:uncharacterized protein (DUF885 family)